MSIFIHLIILSWGMMNLGRLKSLYSLSSIRSNALDSDSSSNSYTGKSSSSSYDICL